MKQAVGMGIVAGVAYGVWRAWQARVPASDHPVEWQTAPFPFPPVPRPPAAPTPAAPAQPWVEANGNGACPKSHPIKAKMSSGIFHVPGGANYERTHPDRCYVDIAAAEADGLRQSKF
jgi:hypothetical protein